jgi:hypothetical protein
MRAPGGQALVEGLVILGLLAGLMGMALTFWRLGSDAQMVSRVAHRDAMACHALGPSCSRLLRTQSPWALDSRQPIRSTPADGQHPGELERGVDQPIAQVSGQSVMEQLGRALAGFRSNTVESLFTLPESHRLIRTHASQPKHQTRRGGFSASVAVTSHDWSSESDAQTLSRVQSGSNPLPWLADAWGLSYSPVSEVLMPTMEWVGLESGSASFRRGFHRFNGLQPFPTTTAPRSPSR